MAAMPMGGWTSSDGALIGTFATSYTTTAHCSVYFHGTATSIPSPEPLLITRIHHAANGYRNGRPAPRPGPERSARLDRRVTQRWCWRRGCRRGR